MNLKQLIDEFESARESLDLDKLKASLQLLQLDEGDLQGLLNFDDDTYQRNLIGRNSNYEMLLLCFEAGQRTPVHDHAGSACGVKVIQGIGVETIFEPTDDGWLYATGSMERHEGGVVGSFDKDIHQLSNLQKDGKRLVTLHVYSPPLGEVGNYNIEDNSIKFVTASSREANTISRTS